MTEAMRRIVGSGHDGKPIFAPKHSHSLLLSAAGGGKTTCGALPWLQSLIADRDRAIIVTDSKNGEIADQATKMCLKAGRKVVHIDGFCVLGEDNPHHTCLNPFGSVIAAQKKNKGELIFVSENVCQALIEEPAGDARNQYWRDEPRTLIEFCLNCLLVRNPRLVTPGAVWSMLSNPKTLLKMAALEADEGSEAMQALANHVLGMAKNEEHFPQHRAAATKALRIYSANSALHNSGVDAEITHEELIKNN